ncbi:MAG: zinc ABC transporter substrate-binding protein [Desulfuromonadaceae bacterium]|nr:zinc ABC transporter substrate-binding protein [Desulfuromonadaceae bacterium]
MPLKLHSNLAIANPKYARPTINLNKVDTCAIRTPFGRSIQALLGTCRIPLTIALLALMLFSLLGPTTLHAAGLRLVASVAPQEYLLNELKTPESTVTVVIRPGQNPTTWDPSPRQMQEIVGADIMFPIGVPFEDVWLPRLRQRAPNLEFADTLAGIEFLQFSEETDSTEHQPADSNQPGHLEHAEDSHTHSHSHGSIDPHIWLDPLRCIAMAANMAAALQQYDPECKAFYAERLEQLTLRLKRLHQEISHVLAPLERRTFMVFHPSWGYFASRYDLRQIALEKDGKEPSGAHLVALIEQARREHIQVIFVQRQFSTKAAQAIAKQTGARIETLDPLASDLPATLRHTADRLAQSMTP